MFFPLPMYFLFVGKGDTGTFSKHRYKLCLCLEEESFHQESFTDGWLFPETPCPKVTILRSILPHGSLTTALRRGFSFLLLRKLSLGSLPGPHMLNMKELELELSIFTLWVVFIPASIPHLALRRSFYRIKSEAKT